MLIDCDTCTVRGQGCDDCVVTVLLGAPPGWRGSDPTVVPLTRRPSVGGRIGDAGWRATTAATTATTAGPAADPAAGPAADPAADPGDALVSGPVTGADTPGRSGGPGFGVVVELDEVERRAVRALAEVGLVPPLRHQPPPTREVG